MKRIINEMYPYRISLIILSILFVRNSYAQEHTAFYEILKNEISHSSNLPSYHPAMEKGSEFVLVVYPGLSLDLATLSYTTISKDNLQTNASALDNACLFASMVNNVIVLQESSYSNYKRLESLVPDEDYLYMSSPAYGSVFGIVGLFPVPQNMTWNNHSRINRNGGQILLTYSMGRMDLQRMWLSLEKLNDKQLPRNSAMITGLLVIKNLHYEKRESGYTVEKITNTSPTIIGLICVVL